jgi:SepF-like predicted cell division protein (DUF552 family)
MVVVLNGTLRERSTQAAAEYVEATRRRLRMDVRRYGDEIRETRAYQQLEQSITAVELSSVWPHADVEEALRQVSDGETVRGAT